MVACAPRYRLFIVALVTAAGAWLGGPSASADVVEWLLTDVRLRSRTTGALTRYFSIVRPDSLRVRYITKNGALLPYRLRRERIGNDSLGQLVSISLGQLALTSSTNIRIALGEDLYASLLESRIDPGIGILSLRAPARRDVAAWADDRTLELALDRVDYRFEPEMAAFVSLGAPESNQFFWADGTMRLGLATPHSEMALVLPFAGGGTAVGPLRTRLLAPGYGAAMTTRYGAFSARARFTAITSAALEPVARPERSYVHTLSSALSVHGAMTAASLPIGYEVGVGFEEFTEVTDDTTGRAIAISRVRRVSPLLEVSYETAGRAVRLALGVNDLAVRGSVLARLTRNLSVELRWVSNRALREQAAFEHPFALFLTPRVTF